jgi:type IV pilus assembly protein PilP
MKARSLLRRSVPAMIVAGILASFFAPGCGTDGSAPPPPPPGAAPPPAAPRPSVLASASASASSAPIVFSEADFTESDSSRDPFHTFTQIVKPTGEAKVVPQYTVVLEKFSVDELKLVAIVSSGDGMRAMFVDPTGKGWVVARGNHVGKGEIVKVGPGAASGYPLHWKVDRIKPGEVVLVREDTLHPEVQPTYREIPLHVEGEKS